MDRGPRDTRRQIQRVALELFTERGYEATALREIAERLGVTKAALYYHFKTKDDIVASLVTDRVGVVDTLIAWAKGQPRGPATRRELLERYGDALFRQSDLAVMRFFDRNQAALRGLPVIDQLRERMLALLNELTEPDDPPTTRLRRSLAIFAMHSSWVVLPEPEYSIDDRRKAALEVALSLANDPA